ncbi:hypothetical protein HY448_02725 [Candidatus Pacearchaeota archaeon]|nr:hypothetical protein [Candidatus Pacearchaeota archaeon]
MSFGFYFRDGSLVVSQAGFTREEARKELTKVIRGFRLFPQNAWIYNVSEEGIRILEDYRVTWEDNFKTFNLSEIIRKSRYQELK